MSFEFFLKALRQLLEPVAVKSDMGKGELEGVVMKKAKTAKAKTTRTAPKKAAKPAAKKAAPKAKVAEKAIAKPKMIATKAAATKAPASKAAKAAKPTKAESKTTKAIELAQKAAAAAAAPKTAAPARTLKEALAGNIKKASELEPEVVLENEAQQDVTEQEKKALARKLAQAGTNFDSVYKIAKAMKPRNYKMSENFEVRTPIMHKVLGWGFILMSENNRIQVLFKDGVKTLITNYQK